MSTSRKQMQKITKAKNRNFYIEMLVWSCFSRWVHQNNVYSTFTSLICVWSRLILQSGEGHLTILSANPSDQGSYQCHASNQAANRESNSAILLVYGECIQFVNQSNILSYSVFFDGVFVYTTGYPANSVTGSDTT